MPTATKFVAEGVGNGFSFCPTTLAVKPVNGILPMSISNYNSLYGATHGYLASGTGNFSSGVSSLGDLMDIYYNLYSFNATATGSWTRGNDSDSHTWTGDLDQVVEEEPNNRVCTAVTPSYRYDDVFVSDYGNFHLGGLPLVYDDGAGTKTYYLYTVSSYFKNTSAAYFIARTYEIVDQYPELDTHAITISGVTFYFSYIWSSGSSEPDSHSSTLTINGETSYTYS